MDPALIDFARNLATAIAFIVGGGFILVGSLGLVRLPDVWSRIHAAGIIDTIGAELILIGMMFQTGLTQTTLKLALIGLFQWGWSDQFLYLVVVYGIIQALDGNVLVPLLFSEAVNLHPVAIICAVLLFGGLWGFWGVFFAIPLATLFKAVLNAWPRAEPGSAA